MCQVSLLEEDVTTGMSCLCSWRKVDPVKLLSVKIVCDGKAIERYLPLHRGKQIAAEKLLRQALNRTH